MEVFVRVAECSSFSRAAVSLGLANATVTASVRSLERHLNVTLIRRDARRFRLTGEGEVYLRHARELLQSVARAEDDVRSQLVTLHGSLHIEAPIVMGQVLLAPVLQAFAQRYPEISTSVSLSNQPHSLIESGIDVAVRFDRVEDSELIARPLYDVQYVLCGAPGLVRSLPAHPSDLDPRLCIGTLPEESFFPSLWRLHRGESRVVIQPQGRLHFNNANAAMSAAKSAIGLVNVMDVFVQPLLDDGVLELAYPDWSVASGTYFVVTTKDRAGAAKVRAFTDFLVEALDPAHRHSAHGAVTVKSLRKKR
jgi:LysR family transcriptional regulator for bpeEF and oprC